MADWRRRIKIEGQEFIIYRVKVWVPGRKNRMWAWRAKAQVPMSIPASFRRAAHVGFVWRTVIHPAGSPATMGSIDSITRYLKYAYFGKDL